MLKNQKSRIYLLAILLFITSLSIFLFTFYLKSSIILEKKEIAAALSVNQIASFNLNKTALTFGTIPPGSSASRNLTLENNYNFPIKFDFRAKGNIKEFLVFDKVIYLEKGEKKSIRISTIIPNNQDYGNYSGKILVTIKKSI